MILAVAIGVPVLVMMLLLVHHHRRTVAADRAVRVHRRPGRMRDVVHATWYDAAPPEDGTERRAVPQSRWTMSVARPTEPGAAVPRFGSLADNALVAASVGAVSLADWWHVDDNVFKAVEALTHEHVGNAVDLWTTVHEHHYTLGEALFTSLRGHVGEQMAADHLTNAGLHVEWPGASNQPGWDLGVDHHLVNVKVTAHADQTLAEHFDKYPHIPALINTDAAHIPHDAVIFDPTHGLDASALVGDHLTLVDQALSLHDAGSAVHDAFGTDALTDAHVPVVGVLVTAVRSGIREGRLLRNGDTDAARAAKNMAVDTTARGLGVIAGAKAGAVTGGMVDLGTGGATLGLGAVFGGIAGAIAGAMGGSAVASHVRHAPLREAADGTKRSLETYAAAVEKQQRAVSTVLHRAEREAKRQLERRRRLAERQLAEDMERLRSELAPVSAFDPYRVIEQSFWDLERRCEQPTEDVVETGSRLPVRYLRRALRRRVRALRTQAEQLAETAAPGGPESEEFWDIIACSAEGDELLREYVTQRVTTQRSAHASCVEHALVQVAGLDNARTAAQHEVQAKLAEAKTAAVKSLEPPAKDLQRSHDRYLREVRAAGIHH